MVGLYALFYGASFFVPEILAATAALLYMTGIIFHLWHRLPYHNAVWHGFVISAAACHWVAVLDGVVRAA